MGIGPAPDQRDFARPGGARDAVGVAALFQQDAGSRVQRVKLKLRRVRARLLKLVITTTSPSGAAATKFTRKVAKSAKVFVAVQCAHQERFLTAFEMTIGVPLQALRLPSS